MKIIINNFRMKAESKYREIVKNVIFCTLFMIISTCVYGQRQNEGYTIEGDLKGLGKDTLIFMSFLKDNIMVVDTTKVQEGRFVFKGKVADPQSAAIIFQNKKRGIRLFLENTPITISGNLDSKTKLQINGGNSVAQFELYKGLVRDLSLKGDSLSRIYKAAELTQDSVTLSAVNAQQVELNKEQAQLMKKFVLENPKSHVSLYLIKGLERELPRPEIEKMFYGLDVSIRNTAGGKKMDNDFQLIARSQVGQPAINFTQNDVNNKQVSMADFKGKYVLIDFWASWCAPCRTDNPKLISIYNKYKDNNFTILGVSLDHDKRKWKDAIKEDHLEWPQVSDLKGAGNALALAYNISLVPYKVLISPEGKIIAKYLWVDEDLIKKLEELFGKESI